MWRVHVGCMHLSVSDNGKRCSKPLGRAVVVDHPEPKCCDRQEAFLITASLHHCQGMS